MVVLERFHCIYILQSNMKCIGKRFASQSEQPYAHKLWAQSRAENTRTSQNPIRHTRPADFGPSLRMFKKAADIEFSYKIMYLCAAAKKNFMMS